MSLNRAIAPSRRRKDRCEFSARLLSQRPQVWAAALPITFNAARYKGLGSASGEAAWQEARNHCPGPAHRRGASPDVAGWHGVPLHARGGDGNPDGIGAAASRQHSTRTGGKSRATGWRPHRCPPPGTRFPMMHVARLAAEPSHRVRARYSD